MKVVATGDVYGPLFEEFTKDTGVTVEVLSMSSGEVLSKLRAEGGTLLLTCGLAAESMLS